LDWLELKELVDIFKYLLLDLVEVDVQWLVAHSKVGSFSSACTVRSREANKSETWSVLNLLLGSNNSDGLDFTIRSEELDQVILLSVGGEASHVQVASPLGNFESVGLFLDGLNSLFLVHGAIDINWRVGAGQDFSVHLLACFLSASGTGLSVLSIFTAVANEVNVALFRRLRKNWLNSTEGTKKASDTFLRVVRFRDVFDENSVEHFSQLVLSLGLVLGHSEALFFESLLDRGLVFEADHAVAQGMVTIIDGGLARQNVSILAKLEFEFAWVEVTLGQVLHKEVLILNLGDVLTLQFSHVGQSSDWLSVVVAVAKLLDS